MMNMQTVIRRGTSIKEVESVVVVFWTHIIGTVVSCAIMLASEEPKFPKEVSEILLIIGHVISAGYMNLSYVIGVKYILAVLFFLFYSVSLVFMLISQYTVMGDEHRGHANALEVIGALMVLTGASIPPVYEMISARFSNNKAKKQKPEHTFPECVLYSVSLSMKEAHKNFR